MELKAIEILNEHRLMTIATSRSDGWPQATMVGYANEGLLIYFLISRRSQKFENISRDDRVSIAIGSEFTDPHQIRGLSIAANASEVTDKTQRDRGYGLFIARHPEFAEFPKPDFARAAIIRAKCRLITVLDYSKGFGHADLLTVGMGELVEMQPARPDDWGFNPSDIREGKYRREV